MKYANDRTIGKRRIRVGSLCRGIAFATTAVLLQAGLSGCGGTETRGHPSRAGTASGASLPQIELKSDAENDSDSYPGEPDNERAQFGHPASRHDAQAITTLIRGYYAAAAAANGAAACHALYSTLAESIVEDYGDSPGVRGPTCAAVSTALFRHSHTRLRAESATLAVRAVRVELNRGAVELGFRGSRSLRYTLVHRERGSWKLDLLFDVAQPVGVE